MPAALLIALPLWLCAARAPAPQDVEPAPRAEPGYDELAAEYERAFTAWRRTIASERDARARVELARRHPAHDFEPRFAALGEQGEGRALVWLLESTSHLRRREQAPAFKQQLLERLVREHAGAPWLGARGADLVLGEEQDLGLARCEALLRELAGTTADASTRWTVLRKLAGRLAASRDDETLRRAWEVFEALLAELAAPDADAELREDVRAEYVRRRSMRVGLLAPDFEAETADGRRFRLSDFRGRVVLVDFWGFWCAACRAELPELAAVGERLSGEPFAIVGVATDEDRAVFERQAREHGVVWTNAWQGGTRGAITAAWGVAAYPTSYLLDAEGRIRGINVRAAQLERAVRELLLELPGRGAGGGGPR